MPDEDWADDGTDITRVQNEEPFMDRASAELFGALVSHSVASLAATTNAIEDHLRDELRAWKRRYVTLFEKVDEEAEKVTTRRLEQVLAHHDMWAGVARRELAQGEDGDGA